MQNKYLTMHKMVSYVQLDKAMIESTCRGLNTERHVTGTMTPPEANLSVLSSLDNAMCWRLLYTPATHVVRAGEDPIKYVAMKP